jgi:hypothetical protein
MPENFDFAEFLHAYIVAALWSSTDDAGEPLDSVFTPDDIAPQTLEEMRADCADFVQSNASDLAGYCARMECGQWTGEQRAGHDFWLTRNGHGAGFWDRGLGDLGARLSDAARVYGGVDLFTADDGLIYC